jgi:hypothetical protein
VRAEVTALKERLDRSAGTIDELADFRVQAVARLAAQHEEIIRLRGVIRGAHHVTQLPQPRTVTFGSCS